MLLAHPHRAGPAWVRGLWLPGAHPVQEEATQSRDTPRLCTPFPLVCWVPTRQGGHLVHALGVPEPT